MTWRRLDEAAIAVQNGARWYACNTDSTRPTERGLVPGAGVAVQAVQVTTRTTPTVTGKPFRPLMEEAVRRTAAKNPIFVGDRLDTDIAGACTIGIDSCLVFTGVHGKQDLIEAPADRRPTSIAWDVPACCCRRGSRTRTPTASDAGTPTCRRASRGSRPSGDLGDREGQLDALWALAQLVWARPGLQYAAALGDLNAVH